MKESIQLICLLAIALFQACSYRKPLIHSVSGYRELHPKLGVASFDEWSNDPYYFVIFPTSICQGDTVITVWSKGDRHKVLHYWSGENLVVVHHGGERYSALKYDDSDSTWIQALKPKSIATILDSIAQVGSRHSGFLPIDSARTISLEEFMQYPKWRGCDW